MKGKGEVAFGDVTALLAFFYCTNADSPSDRSRDSSHALDKRHDFLNVNNEEYEENTTHYEKKQLIQLCTFIYLDLQKVLEHTLGIHSHTFLTMDEVLDCLQDHFNILRNKAIRCHDIICCKQVDSGESSCGFYVRLKHLAEEVDLWSGDPITYAET
ncbi:hypothetical protein SK128_023810 [Halocaridina rubra]|uniref:Uncharacterized protein n=1 Tax=Halocaridina rubra TaxID=373956 RepID=A0AAN8ZUT4_HALRR